MRRHVVLPLLAALVAVVLAGPLAGRALAIEGMVDDLSPDIDRLELYASPTAETAELKVAKKDLGLPTPILEVSNNGMYRIRYKGTDYWVISDDVSSSVERQVDTECDPKMAGNIVAHGVRGAGEGCQ